MPVADGKTREDARREAAGRKAEVDDWRDAFYLQGKLVLLALHFPRLRIVWSASPHESVKILSDLKLNHEEPDEVSAILKGSSSGVDGEENLSGGTMENAGAVEMLRAIPGVSGHALKYVMSKVEGMQELVGMSEKALCEVLGDEAGHKAYSFIHADSRRMVR